MRIVAGRYGGRKLMVPKGRDIRPTSDKVRGAVFNMLDSRGAVQGALVLDAFCGTGALGFEALSRGARHCTFIDKNSESLKLCRANAQALGAEGECRFFLQGRNEDQRRSERTLYARVSRSALPEKSGAGDIKGVSQKPMAQ